LLLALAGALCALALGGGAAAQRVLHEFIDLGPGLDPVEPEVTGQYPARAAGAPRSGDGPGSGVNGAGGSGARAGADASGAFGAPPDLSPQNPLAIDNDTTRATRVSYEDPFTPTVVPFKRGVVYDSVTRDGELVVRDARLRSVPAASALLPSDEHFHAALTLQLRPGEKQAIPSVAPGARLVMAHSIPAAALSFALDSAENWYVRSESAGQFQVTLQIAVDRRVFGGAFRETSWGELSRELPPLPAPVRQSALEVARALGVPDGVKPQAAVLQLVDYFRRFRPSDRRPTSHGLALYRELALTARGICRHRSYAFMITALGLGIPTRVAVNEAHAWVEVWDGTLWHRIDLGGAAEELEMSQAGRPQHVMPRDPFSWPSRSESGSSMAQRRIDVRDAPAAEAPGAEAVRGAGGASARDPGADQLAAPGTDLGELEDDGVEPLTGEIQLPVEELAQPEAPLRLSKVTLTAGARNAERGKALLVSGRVQSGGRSCAGMSVQVDLTPSKAPSVPLGTLISDEAGNFSGRLIVPWSAPLGEHTLSARAVGGCEPQLR
jgi:transglutaminase-like putative cysteine protease